MQKLTSSQQEVVEGILRRDRQWKRDVRIKFARAMLQEAVRLKLSEEIILRREVFRRLNWDYVDKASQSVR